MSSRPIARQVAEDLDRASWIREMFERGRRLRAQFGDANVFDLSLGNPNATPPEAFFSALEAVARERRPELHRYMPNAGLDETREAVAAFLSDEYGVGFDASSVIMTSGAAGGLNVVLRTILDSGDEVIVLAPYFPEYRFHVRQANGFVRVVQTDEAFQPDLDAIEAAIGPRTRAIILNSPNNPTGVVYTQPRLDALTALLRRHDRDDAPIYLVLDDPYRRICYLPEKPPTPLGRYARCILVSSYSKDLSIPGERMGYMAVPPELPGRDALLAGLTMLNRTLGFVNAPALMQRVVARCADAICDLSMYRQNRDRLCAALREMGYAFVEPAGALYVFPRTPIDDVQFAHELAERRVLVVPGRGFGREGHIRISFCVPPETIEGALPVLRDALRAHAGCAASGGS